MNAGDRQCLPTGFRDWKTDKQVGGRQPDGPPSAAVQAQVTAKEVPVALYRENQAPLIANNVPLWTNFLWKAPTLARMQPFKQWQGAFFPSEHRDTDLDKD